MRLPWPFGRRTPPDGPSSAATGVGGGGARPADPVPPAFPAAPAPTGAWSRLPPIQRTIGAAPLVAPSASFLEDVPGHRALPPILQPLGHETSSVAPAGLVVAHARPVPALTSHAELPTRHVQRHAAGRSEALDAAGSAIPAEALPVAGAPAPEPEPVRRLPAVPAAATVTPPARPLTRAPAPLAAGGPVVARSAAGAARPATPDGTTPGLSASTTAGTATPARATRRWAEGPADLADPSASADSTASTAGAAAVTAERALDLGPRRGGRELRRPGTAPAPDDPAGHPRRPGLGAPIPVPPASAVAQRLPMRVPVRRPDGAPWSAGATPPGPQSGADPGRGAASEPSGAPPVVARAASVAGNSSPETSRLPVLPVVRRGDRTVATADPYPRAAASRPRTTHLATPPADVVSIQRTGSHRPTRPTLGFRPLRPGVRLSPAGEGHGEPPAASATAAEPTVAARWDAPGDLPPVIGPASLAGAASAISPSLVPLQRTSPEPAGAPSRGASATDLPGGGREIVFPARDALPTAGLPVAGMAASTTAPRAGHATPPMPGAAATRNAGRPLTLARTVAPATSAVAASARTAGDAPVVGRVVADPAGPSVPPSVQTSQAGGPAGTPVASITATPVVQRVEGSAPAAESGPAQRSDSELDDLARALFGRIRSHLRAEVIHEREAKGLTFDAF